MRLSETGIKKLIQREGRVLHVYRDSKGLPTLGIGHLLTDEENARMPVGTKITAEQCDEYFRTDIQKYEKAVNNSVRVPLSQNEFDALVSFCFNIGISGFQNSSVVRRLNNGKSRQEVADAIMMWKKPPEIIGRRTQEKNQFLTPYKTVSAAAEPKPDTTTVSTPTEPIGSNADTSQGTQAGLVDTSTTPPPQLVVEKEPPPKGFFDGIKAKITGWWATIGGMEGAKQAAGDAQFLGLTQDTWRTLTYIAIGIGGVLFLGYSIKYLWTQIIGPRLLTTALVHANANLSDATTVEVADVDNIAELEKKGYQVIRRK